MIHPAPNNLSTVYKTEGIYSQNKKARFQFKVYYPPKNTLADPSMHPSFSMSVVFKLRVSTLAFYAYGAGFGPAMGLLQ